MTVINAEEHSFSSLNEAIRGADENCVINGCLGHTFIAAGMNNKI